MTVIIGINWKSWTLQRLLRIVRSSTRGKSAVTVMVYPIQSPFQYLVLLSLLSLLPLLSLTLEFLPNRGGVDGNMPPSFSFGYSPRASSAHNLTNVGDIMHDTITRYRESSVRFFATNQIRAQI